MGDPQEKIRESKPKATRRHFLGGCFGISWGSSSASISQKKKLLVHQQQPAADHYYSKQEKSTGFSWSTTRFSRNYKHGTKTFPVDASLASEKKMKMKMKMNYNKIENKRIHAKKKSKLEGKSNDDKVSSSNGQYIRAAASSSSAVQNRPSDTAKVVTSNEASEEEKPQEEKIIRENGKCLDHKDAPKAGLCQLKRLSFRRKIDAGQPGSPEDNPNSSGTTTTACSTTSFPAPTHPEAAGNPAVAVQCRVMVKKPPKRAQDATMVKVKAKCLGPEIGMSIIMVTMMVLFLYGRVCAILCTCAFLYFVPRLRDTVDHLDAAAAGGGKDNSVSDQLDFNSEEYKKRVVLEGLLERKSRPSP